jgi:hypothetical protein
MKRTLGAHRICLPGSNEEVNRTASIPRQQLLTAAPTARQFEDDEDDDDELDMPGAFRSISPGLPDLARLGLGGGEDPMLMSRLDGTVGSPRLEMRRVFGGGIAR